jgi:hypothetical protein
MTLFSSLEEQTLHAEMVVRIGETSIAKFVTKKLVASLVTIYV